MRASSKASSGPRSDFSLSQAGPSPFDVARGSTDTVLKGTLKGTRNCAIRLAVNAASESTTNRSSKIEWALTVARRSRVLASGFLRVLALVPRIFRRSASLQPRFPRTQQRRPDIAGFRADRCEDGARARYPRESTGRVAVVWLAKCP